MKNSFGVVDYILCIAMFMVSIGFGIYFGIVGRRNQNTQQYLMGDRKLSLIPVALSISVSVLSTNTILGVPAEVYGYGVMIFFMLVGELIASILTVVMFVPLFYRLKLVSVNQYLEMRFNSKSVRLLGSLFFFLNSIFYVGTVIFGPATALNIVTGIPPWASIALVSVVGTLYTTIGGMKAVIWADAFQSIIMCGGMLAICILGANAVGGIQEVWTINQEWGRLKINNNIDLTSRFSMGAVVIGYTHYWLGKFAVNQPCVQRYCAMETQLKGKLAVLLNIPPFAIFHCLAVLTGMVTFAFYASEGCDPIKAGYVTNQNQVVPYFVLDVMPYPGISGIFMSSVFSAALSTQSSSISSMTAVAWEDVLKDKYSHLTPQKQAFVTKILTVVFGIACTGTSFLVLYVGGNLIQISSSFNGATLGPMLGLFLLGPLVPWANWKGALVGGISALTFSIWLMFGQVFSRLQRTPLPSSVSSCIADNWNTTSSTTILPQISTTEFFTAATNATDAEVPSGLKSFYSISFVWFTMFSAIIVLIVGTIVSFLTGPQDSSKIDQTLLFPCFRQCKSMKQEYKSVKVTDFPMTATMGEKDFTKT